MPQQAQGLPNPKDYGDMSKLTVGQLLDYIVQRHQARRAGLHYDVRLGTPDTGMYSWAVRKGVPEAGKKHLAVQQPVHEHDYNQFEGEIPSGYGAGTVSKHDEGKVLLTKLEPDKVHFTLAHRRYPERFVLFKPEGGIGKKENNWLLMNTTPTEPVPYDKIKYKSIPADKVEHVLRNLNSDTSVQAKIDGAASLTKILKDKIEVLSYRKSKVHGGPILHTERVFKGIPETTVPPEYVGSVLRGELYGEQDGKAIDPQRLGSFLNSSIAKSLPAQEQQGVTLKNIAFDIDRLGKNKVDHAAVPYATRLQNVRSILSRIGGPDGDAVRQTITPTDEVHGEGEASKLLETIKAKQHPLTQEGIVLHPPTGKPLKSKLYDEHDVHIRGFFPGKGKYQDKGIGGFVYSHEPDGPIAGEVGTGFDDALRTEMFNNPKDYVGRVARVSATSKLRSGALFQPSLIALHEDYPKAPVKEQPSV
jgi:DNA ligase D-like protein (predicted 3'-phosphoesterase)